jgi:hypothetical protein
MRLCSFSSVRVRKVEFTGKKKNSTESVENSSRTSREEREEL